MNILLTSVGRRSYMVNYFREAMVGMGLVHAANSEPTYAMQVAEKSVITPLIYDGSYIDFLLKYCRENEIGAIISLFDIDLPVLSKNKKLFHDSGVQIIISDYELIQVCNDKWKTYKFLKGNGFNVPQTFVKKQEVVAAIQHKKIDFPIIIKPRWGMGSIGIFQADNYTEFEVLYQKTLNSINNSYLRFESGEAPDECVIVQEKLVGQEYGLDIFHDLSGKFLTSVPKKKLAMRAGETDIAEIVDDPKLTELCNRLSVITKHIGNLDVDCFYVAGKYYILEMNCRFGGQYPFSHLAGVNFPRAIIQMLLDEKPDLNILKPIVGTIGVKDLIPVKIK